MGLGVELLLGEQRALASLLFIVTTQLMSLLKNSSTAYFIMKRIQEFNISFQKHFILLESSLFQCVCILNPLSTAF